MLKHQPGGVNDSLIGTIVSIDHQRNPILRQGFLVHCEAMILRRDVATLGSEIHHRLIHASISELHLVSRCTCNTRCWGMSLFHKVSRGIQKHRSFVRALNNKMLRIASITCFHLTCTCFQPAARLLPRLKSDFPSKCRRWASQADASWHTEHAPRSLGTWSDHLGRCWGKVHRSHPGWSRSPKAPQWPAGPTSPSTSRQKKTRKNYRRNKLKACSKSVDQSVNSGHVCDYGWNRMTMLAWWCCSSCHNPQPRYARAS